MEVSSQPHAPAALPWDTSPSTYRMGGWLGHQSRFGRPGEEKETHIIASAENWTPVVQPVA
jgi:hypothetical protein